MRSIFMSLLAVLFIILIVFFAVGCSNPEPPKEIEIDETPVGEVVEGKLVNTEYNAKGRNYYFIVKIDSTTAKFQVMSENQWKAISNGSIISFKYNKEYQIVDLALHGTKEISK